MLEVARQGSVKVINNMKKLIFIVLMLLAFSVSYAQQKYMVVAFDRTYGDVVTDEMKVNAQRVNNAYKEAYDQLDHSTTAPLILKFYITETKFWDEYRLLSLWEKDELVCKKFGKEGLKKQAKTVMLEITSGNTRSITNVHLINDEGSNVDYKLIEVTVFIDTFKGKPEPELVAEVLSAMKK